MRIPTVGPRARLIALAYGIGLLLWLSLEENSVAGAALLGLGLAALILVLTTADKLGSKRVAASAVPPAAALLGAAIGLGAAVAGASLMFFKNALHAHVFPDYPVSLIGALLGRGPAWTLAGALLGLGAGLTWLALRAPLDNPDDQDDERQV